MPETTDGVKWVMTATIVILLFLGIFIFFYRNLLELAQISIGNKPINVE